MLTANQPSRFTPYRGASSSKIRNIIQTTQERDIIKTAPDMVVYIDSLPWINNPYLSNGNSSIVPVNFNDYIMAINTSYSIDSFIPSGTITLNVPNGSKHLFMAPGGNTIIDLMSMIRIYAKSYFFASDGSTVFRRIFNGVIKSVDMNENATGMDITIGIVGICRLLEITQVELNKSLLSNSSSSITVFRSNQASMSPYAALYDTFARNLEFSEFLNSSFLQSSIKSLKDSVAIKEEYCSKWARMLTDVRRDVRLFGISDNKAITDSITKVSNYLHSVDPKKRGATQNVWKDLLSEMAKENAQIISYMRQYHFDMAIGGIKLFGSQLTPRIERIKYLVELMGFEGYQDVDGLIIIKPPLYNLDCTLVSNGSETPSQLSSLSDENISQTNNPFIINMSEILSETYNEDETAIRRTSMTIAPNFGSPGGIQIENQIDKTPVTRYVDINLMRKYGVREEPPKYCGFLGGDRRAAYAFAVCELNKANRAFRTYNVSIPLRPEIRMGFPIYLPHKDMYAYVTAVAMSYNVGGQAITSLTCNYIRKRPLFPQIQTITTTDPETGVSTSSQVQTLSSQPNLVHAFTNQAPGASASANGVFSEEGVLSSLPPTPSQTPSQKQLTVRDLQTQKMGSIYETWVDKNNTGWTWRILPDLPQGNAPAPGAGIILDSTGTWYNGMLNETTGVYQAAKVTDGHYMDRSIQCQPYTNEKGYEVLPLLPWGRYSSLNQAIIDCTRGYWYTPSTADAHRRDNSGTQPVLSAFLMSGLVSPQSTPAVSLAADQSTAAAQSSSTASTDTPALVTNQFLFERFDKSNVISFKLAYTDSDTGKTETDFAIPSWSNPNYPASGSVSGAAGANNAVPTSSITAGLQTWSNNVDALQVFLQGFMGPTNSNNVRPYAVSTAPQNTDIGGYSPSAGPFSGVLLSMAATFNRSPYGAILGLRPTGATQDPNLTQGTNATYTGDTLGQTLTNIGQIFTGGGS